MSKLQLDNLSIVVANENLSVVLEIIAEGKRIIVMVFPEDPTTLHVNENSVDSEDDIVARTLAQGSLEAYLDHTLPETFTNDNKSDLIRLFMIMHVYPSLGIPADEYTVFKD